MVSAYEMFAAFVDLVVGTFEWITWPIVVLSWPLRAAVKWILVWWSYLTKVIVYGVLDTILWPVQVISAARREKEVSHYLYAKLLLLNLTTHAQFWLVCYYCLSL